MVKIKIDYKFVFGIFWSAFVFCLTGMLIILLTKDRFGISSRCSSLKEDAKKIECWKKIIDTNLARGDLDGSMSLVAEFYQIDSVFAANCHDFTHSVGKKAYELFSKGVKFQVGSKTSYCAYGIYHGFMENLVAKSGDIQTARDFCRQVDAELSKTSPGAKFACYHGIGHGWTNVHDSKFSGDELAIIKPSLALCEKVTDDSEELKICATGVFDSISIGYYNKINNLVMNKKDPYWLCKLQSDKYKQSCYMDISPAVLWLGDYNLDKALAFVATVEPKFRSLVTKTLSEDSVRFILRDSKNIETQIDICRKMGGEMSGMCIKGIAQGYLQFGPPKEEERLALIFCGNNYLTENEKQLCYGQLSQSVKIILPDERYKEACSKIPEQYQEVCI